MRFWDASAVIAMFVAEPHTATVRTLHGSDPDVVIWWGTPVECASATARRVREGLLSPAQASSLSTALQAFETAVPQVAPSSLVRDHAKRLLLAHPLRSADALQLASALVWCGHRTSGIGFVCLDDRLRAAALSEGFTVLPL